MTRVQNSLALPRVVDVRPRQLIIHGDITIDEAEGLASQLEDASEDIKWCRGDLIVYGQERFGEDTYQIVPEGDAENWMRYARLSALYPPEERTYDVSWSLYYIARSRDDRRELLAKAEAEQWTAKALSLYMSGNVRERPNWRAIAEERLDYLNTAMKMCESGRSVDNVAEYIRSCLN